MDKEIVLVFDGSYFLSRFSKSKYKLYNSDGINIYPLYYTLKLIADNIIRYKPKEVYFVIDIGRDIRKKQKLEEYKKKRLVKKEKLYSSVFAEDEYEDYSLARNVITNLSYYLPIRVIPIPLVEGDTVVYYIADRKSKEGYHSIVFTGDKDMLQIVDENISISLSNREKGYEFLTIDRYDYIYSKLDFYVNSSQFFHPRNISYYRAMVGDTSDNIVGIKGIGTKAISKLIKLAQDNSIKLFDTPIDFIEFYEEQYNKLSNKQKSLKNIISKFLNNIEHWLNVFEIMDLRYSAHEELSGIKISQLEREINKEITFDIRKVVEIFRQYDIDSEPRYFDWLLAFESLYNQNYSLLNERMQSLSSFTSLLTELDNKIQKYLKY